MDPWYYLNCHGCRSQLRIKADYTHMRGRCPACGLRIEPPIPKPLTIKIESNHDEPVGLIPEEEEWPEPATLVEEQESSTDATYGLSAQEKPSVRVRQEEEEPGGVYTLAFEPDTQASTGVTRSVEWDQGRTTQPERNETDSVVASDSTTETPDLTKRSRNAGEPPQPTPEPLPTDPSLVVYESVVDPLFGDVVHVPKTSATKEPEPVPTQPTTPTAKPVPLARHATESDELSGIDTPCARKPRKRKPSLRGETPPRKAETRSRPVSSKRRGEEESLPETDTSFDGKHIYRLSGAEENRIPLDPPPKSLFFEGVFGFPLATGNKAVWVWLSLGFSTLLLMGWLINLLMGMGQAGIIGAGAVAMGTLWVGVWTFSYASAALLNTITYTAAGSREVDWPQEGWKEWFPSFLKVLYYFGLGLIMTAPLMLAGVNQYVWLAFSLFAFPIFLFSGMASMTFWNFLHAGIIKTTIQKGHLYLVFYGLSLIVVVGASVLCGFSIHYVALVPVAGPLFAAAWLIYSRLLGRMAFVLQEQGESDVKRKRRKKKRRVEEAESEPDSVKPQRPEDEPLRMAHVEED